MRIIVIAIISIVGFSCKKNFLDPGLTNRAETTEFIKSLSTCEQVLNGAYIKFTSPFFNGQYNVIYGELIADNVKPRVGSTTYVNQYGWAQAAGPNGANMDVVWEYGYAVIRQLNIVLENVDRFSSENPQKANDLKGQALALRALVHFYLVNIFAQPYAYTVDASHDGVPYITVSDITIPVKRRESVLEVYNNMITDLNNATSLLTSAVVGKLVMNKNAADALLARIYLYKSDYINAKKFSRKVGSLVPIMTSNYPGNLFTANETEAIFQLIPTAPNVNGGAGTGTSYAGIHFNPANPQFVATQDIVTLLMENITDLRKAWVQQTTNFGWVVKKYPTNVIPGFPDPTYSHFQTLMRSSEMYLISAECYSKLNNDDSARYFINAIRQRSNLPALPVSITGANLLDSIMKERRREMCFEGGRMFDLLRNSKGVVRGDAPNPTAVNLPYPSIKAIAPIPFVETDVNGLRQNAGY